MIWIRAFTYLAGAVCCLSLVAILADLLLIVVMIHENSQNAWYFPYSVFTLPLLVVGVPVFVIGRRALRRRRDVDT